MEDCREQEEKREDDCGWDGGHVLPEVVGSSVCFEFGHVQISGCVIRVCRWVLDIDWIGLDLDDVLGLYLHLCRQSVEIYRYL